MDPGSALLRSLSGMTMCFSTEPGKPEVPRATLRRIPKFALDHGARAGKLHDGVTTRSDRGRPAGRKQRSRHL
jgi:hypothetical protein